MKVSSGTVFAVVLAASHCAFAYSWKTYDGDPDNILTNAQHFYNGSDLVDPTTFAGNSYLMFPTPAANKSLTITHQSGAVFENPTGPLFQLSNAGSSITVDATGAIWRQPILPSDVATKYSGYNRFQFRDSGTTQLLRMYESGNTLNGAFMISNAVFRFTRDASNNLAFDLDHGLLDLYTPNSVALGNLYAQTFNLNGSSAPSASMRFHAGSCVRLPRMSVYGYCASNEVLFDGGNEHFIYQFLPIRRSDTDTVADRTKLIVTGVDTKLTLERFSCEDNGNHRYRVIVRNGGTLAIQNYIYQLAGFDNVIALESGGHLVVDKTGSMSWYNVNFAATNAFVDSSRCAVSCTSSSARLRLKATEWRVSSIAASASCTDSSLYADGSVIRASAANSNLVKGFSVAACGADGLTIASDYDVTIPQSFSSLEGAAGELILTGSGTKTLSGTSTTVSRIVVAGGTVVFSDGARAASELVVTNGAKVVFAGDPSAVGLTGLVVGDAATFGALEFSAGQTLAVNGDIAINDAAVSLADDFAIGSDVALLSASGAVSASSRTAWAAAFVGAGAAAGRDYAFSAAESGGDVVFRMVVIEAPSLLIEHKAGTRDYAEAYPFSANARLTVAVSNAATLIMSGQVGNGGLDKVGGGKFYLLNDGNTLLGGVTSAGGLFSVPSVAALGCNAKGNNTFLLGGGTLEFTSSTAETYPGTLIIDAGANTAAVIKNEGDLEVKGLSVVSGDLVKRGAGTLTIAPPSGTTTLAVDHGTAANSYDPANRGNVVFAEDGTAPTCGYLGLNVAEGELVLKGDASTVFDVQRMAMVGMNTTDGTVQPALTIDGATVSFKKLYDSSYGAFNLGGFQTSTSMAHSARLTIKNGANAEFGTLCAGRAQDSGAGYTYPTTLVENATISAWRLMGSSASDCRHALIARGATLNCTEIWTAGPNTFDFTNSVVRKDASGNYIDATVGYNSGSWTFRAGSLLKLSSFAINTRLDAFTLSFDGGTWDTGGVKPTFHLYYADKFTFRALGNGGLTLPVAAGKTVGVARAISGDGPIVKTGAGALVFETQGIWDSAIATKTPMDDPVSLATTGILDVREGSVSVEPGACRVGGSYRAEDGASVDFGGNALGAAYFVGAGMFSNFSATGAKIVSDGEGVELPQFSSASFGGVTRVDFGGTKESPIAWKGVENLPVARFVGMSPNLAGWRVSGIGVSNVGGEFSFADGVVRVTLVSKGCIITFK